MNIKFKNKTTVVITKSLGWSGKRPAPDQKAIIKKNSVLAEFKKQHPDLDIRFVFSNSKTKIGKKSKTTYAKWCELKGFKYHCVYSTGKMLPDEWVKELHQQQKKL